PPSPLYTLSLHDALPIFAVESFAGVANPFSLGRLEPGERVLDLGCGAGTDSLVAAQMVGPEGHVVGIDMTREMLDKARRGAAEIDRKSTRLNSSHLGISY